MSRNRPATAWNGISLVCDSQCVSEHLNGPFAASDAISPTMRLLPIPGGPTSPTMRPLPVHRLVEHRCDGAHLPVTPHQRRHRRARCPPSGAIASRRRAITGDCAPLIRTFSGSPRSVASLDQPCRGLTEHHPAGRRDRFHPLRQSDLFTDRGVIQTARTDLTGDHRAGIQSDPQKQGETRSRCSDLGRDAAAPPAGCPAPPGTPIMRDPPTQPARRTPP